MARLILQLEQMIPGVAGVVQFAGNAGVVQFVCAVKDILVSDVADLKKHVNGLVHTIGNLNKRKAIDAGGVVHLPGVDARVKELDQKVQLLKEFEEIRAEQLHESLSRHDEARAAAVCAADEKLKDLQQVHSHMKQEVCRLQPSVATPDGRRNLLLFPRTVEKILDRQRRFEKEMHHVAKEMEVLKRVAHLLALFPKALVVHRCP